MRQHIIRFVGLAATVDDLRDTLAEVAGPQLVTRVDSKKRDHFGHSRHLYWQGRQLNTLRLRTLLHQLGIQFCDAQGQPLRAPPPCVLAVFLSMAAMCNWFAPGECGRWMRAHNPPWNKVQPGAA